MAKPRTNEETALFWGATATERGLPDALELNSVSIKNRPVHVGMGEERTLRYWRTEIYSFGWYCMGVIVREAKREDVSLPGRVVRIVTNADQYPHQGWAKTPEDQGAVNRAASLLSERTGVRAEKLPLTATHLHWGWDPSNDVPYSHHTKNLIRVVPRTSDPCPTFEREEIPPYFNSTWPGPEPVDTGVGCEAGRIDTYCYEQDEHLWLSPEHMDDQAYTERMQSDLGAHSTLLTRPGDFFTKRGGSHITQRAYVGTVVWGSDSYCYRDDHARPYLAKGDRFSLRSGYEYRQCAHCKAHAERHERWHRFMHGGYRMGRNKGWALHSALVHKYGSEDGWREARREFCVAQRAYYAELRRWIKRNFIPLEHIRNDRHGLPRFTSDGYAYRKDGDEWVRYRRRQERAERQRQRDCERRERERRQLERWRRSVERRRRKSFLTLAAEVAQNLASISAELQSTDNDTPLEGT